MKPVVLVVEDEPLIRFVAVDALEGEGYTVHQAATADEAIGILSEFHVDVVFTDVNMPGALDGVELAKHVASLYPTVGIIVTSGRFHIGSSLMPAGACFLPKPYNLDKLANLVEQLTPVTVRHRAAEYEMATPMPRCAKGDQS